MWRSGRSRSQRYRRARAGICNGATGGDERASSADRNTAAGGKRATGSADRNTTANSCCGSRDRSAESAVLTRDYPKRDLVSSAE
jgi:hypothetical protein